MVGQTIGRATAPSMVPRRRRRRAEANDIPRGVGVGPRPRPPRPLPPFRIGRLLADDRVAHREAWRHSLRVAVPSCPTSPWKDYENLRGDCRAELKPSPGGGGAAATTIAECATSCCDDPTCVSWQHRRDVGCLRGGDVRLGMEKDGVPAWCSDHPPRRWRGQFLVGCSRNGVADDGGWGMGGSSSVVVESRKLACDESTWNPEEEGGQCFGLGDVRPNEASGSAVECMRACCGDPTCGAWQWNEVVRSAHPRRYYLSRPVR